MSARRLLRPVGILAGLGAVGVLSSWALAQPLVAAAEAALDPQFSLLALGDTGTERGWLRLLDPGLAVADALAREDSASPVDGILLLGDNFYPDGLLKRELALRVRPEAESLGLSLAVVCSINSLLLNGNPLLRYDGYFVLADYWEIPNLFQQSRDRLRQLAVRWSTGLELPQRRSTPAPDRLLVPYGIASIAYRWFVVLAIWWVLWHGLRPWGLEALATVLLTLTVAAMLAPLIWSAAKFLHNPLRGRNAMSL